MIALDDTGSAILAWQQSRCQRAAAWIVRAHQPAVLRIAHRWRLPVEMQDDAVQEIFVRVFQALPRYTTERPFECWLNAIAHNTCSKLRRRWQHRQRLSACFENAALDVTQCSLRDRQSAPDRVLMRREFHLRVTMCLEVLPERDRRLIERSWQDEPSEPQPTSAERTALCRARAKMREAFQQWQPVTKVAKVAEGNRFGELRSAATLRQCA